MRRSSRVFVVAVAVFSVLMLSATAAWAGSPHLIKNLTGATVNGTSLDVFFKEAGLESGSTETITATATVTETWFCVNNGGANPSASNKRTFTTDVSVSGEFTADKNGNVQGTLTISPFTPADFCPSGQTMTLGSVTYSNVSITDEDSDAFFAIPGTFSTGCLLPPDVRLKGSCT
jgi:type II secretory pathway pseudopilin PulG